MKSCSCQLERHSFGRNRPTPVRSCKASNLLRSNQYGMKKSALALFTMRGASTTADHGPIRRSNFGFPVSDSALFTLISVSHGFHPIVAKAADLPCILKICQSINTSKNDEFGCRRKNVFMDWAIPFRRQ